MRWLEVRRHSLTKWACPISLRAPDPARVRWAETAEGLAGIAALPPMVPT